MKWTSVTKRGSASHVLSHKRLNTQDFICGIDTHYPLHGTTKHGPSGRQSRIRMLKPRHPDLRSSAGGNAGDSTVRTSRRVLLIMDGFVGVVFGPRAQLWKPGRGPKPFAIDSLLQDNSLEARAELERTRVLADIYGFMRTLGHFDGHTVIKGSLSAPFQTHRIADEHSSPPSSGLRP